MPKPRNDHAHSWQHIWIPTIPLRGVLILPFVLLLSVTVGLIGWLSIRNGEHAIHEVASQLRHEVSNRILERLYDYLSTPHIINHINADAVQLNVLMPQDYITWQQVLAEQLDLFSDLSFIQLGTEQGHYLGMGRLADESLVLEKTVPVADGVIYQQHQVNNNGEPIELRKQVDHYDITTQAWYQTALQNQAIGWSEVHHLPSTQQLGLIATRAFTEDTDGQATGFFVSHLPLARISEFLQRVKVGWVGEVFITDRNGLLLASSSDKSPFIRSSDYQGTLRVAAIDSPEPLVRETAKFLTDYFGSLSEIEKQAEQLKIIQQLEFTRNGIRHFVQITPFRDGRGLDWLIIIVAPETAFLETIHHHSDITVLIALIALMIALLIGSLTSRWITKPIQYLKVASQKLAAGHWEQRLPTERRDEIGALAQSFSSMALQLRDSFNRLERFNQSLEELVDIRTQELSATVAELEKARYQAESANRAKSEFLANMTHELLTPMNAILGFTQLLQLDSNLRSDQQESLKMVEESGQQLLKLINEVLEIAKLETGQAGLIPQNFDFHQLLHHIKERVRIRAEHKGLEVIFERNSELPQYLRADASKLAEILFNLLDNALKFTESGYIALRVSYQTKALQTHRLFFEIADTGQGIEDFQQDSLFEGLSLNTKQRGAGLSLCITRQYIRMMGGDIQVNSQVGEGSVFAFDVQVELAALEDITHHQTHHVNQRVIGLVPNQPHYKLLVVEDRQENRLLLTQLLKTVGFHVEEAVNGEQAVEICQMLEPDLIWMDLRMPVMDGFAAMQQIKAHPCSKDIVIIALTANAATQERQAILEAGFADLVIKPFKESTIFNKLAEHLGVQYIYDTPTTNPLAEILEIPTAPVLTAEALSKLSETWLREMQLAAAQVDSELAMAQLELIMESHPELVTPLTQLVQDFNFEEILELTRQALNLAGVLESDLPGL